MHTIIAGRKPVMEALKAGTKIEKVVFLLGVQGKIIQEIRNLAERGNVPVAQVGKQEFRQLATNATTQGVVAVVPTRRYVDLEDVLQIPIGRNERGFLVLLDEIEDPHNLGAIVRTAECAGAHGLVVPKHHSAPVTSAVVKASAGATEHLALAEVPNLVQAMDRLKGLGYWITGLDAGGDASYAGVDYSGPVAIVVGNEGKGLRRLVREHCDYLVKIPMYGRIASLNASVAAALVMYEVARQRHSHTNGSLQPDIAGAAKL